MAQAVEQSKNILVSAPLVRANAREAAINRRDCARFAGRVDHLQSLNGPLTRVAM